ncbi:phage head morphogenesis protein [Pacificibacter marinus]|uniref:phage head morphogenesis protein n=1 Tax=Pacificibacter marinus TaxID=658057 RepID=UPI001C07AF64|nr:phage minor head protein [Pacificibacter marinus]MBU2867129.1 hypothetical protein [Pacificibacter marinus]
MPDTLANVFRQPFSAQLTAFRLRLLQLVPTFAWDDLIAAQHDRAFMVAGATKADLLADLAAAVEKAIAEGTTFETFKQDFRNTVQRHGWHGWTGEGTKRGEEWRMRVIYDTNLQTTYMAGRHAQLITGNYPFWVYRHGGSYDPRPQHLAWDGLILPSDHPFWRSHFPPNDWGCSCRVFGARSEAGARRVGGKPEVQLGTNWAAPLPKTGAPAGVGKGWDYAPGASVSDLINALSGKVGNWPPELAEAFLKSLPEDQRAALVNAAKGKGVD